MKLSQFRKLVREEVEKAVSPSLNEAKLPVEFNIKIVLDQKMANRMKKLNPDYELEDEEIISVTKEFLQKIQKDLPGFLAEMDYFNY